MVYSVGALLVILALAAVAFFPLVTIWSLNTLFGLSIDYTFWTWLAMIWLHSNMLSAVSIKLKR